MRSLEDSRARWQITLNHASSLEALKKSVRDRNESPCESGLRSVCWKAFLLFRSTTNINSWSGVLKDSRSAYTSLREHLLRYIENPDELGSALDPLDDDQNSPWNTARLDEQLRAEIFQDVERCMPEEPYFRLPETQRTMLDILFIFCKINQDVGYRQGMHELLAPVLWVVQQDAIDFDSRGPSTASQREDLLEQTLDSNYIEHDAFTLLSLMMRSAKSFYELGEPERRLSAPSSGSRTPLNVASPIVERSKRIHEVYLAQLDPELANHLTIIEVLPQVFLIRWIRLLFGREFPFDELLTLWDTLLAEDPELELVDLVCVAMLLRIRWQLITANYSLALMLLLKYPSPEAPHGPRTFVDDAIYVRDNFSAAGGAFIINKYSGKLPPVQLPTSRPSTPIGQALSPRQKSLRTKSPLPSPSRFLQQQGGVEAILQGAAKGVFERGERLGINQAVRDAVGEVRKNMQGLQSSRANSHSRRASDLTRWSLDEGRAVPSPRASGIAMEVRNQQLARMLEQAMKDLGEVSNSKIVDKEGCVRAMEAAIAKVEFVRIHLEDSAIPVPQHAADAASPRSSLDLIPTPSKSSHAETSLLTKPKPLTTPTSMSTEEPQAKPAEIQSAAIPQNAPPASSTIEEAGPPTAPSTSSPAQDTEASQHEAVPEMNSPPARPSAPVPTRSRIAQSSFSWMLEPDTPSESSARSPPFAKSGSRPNSGPNRQKAAFLFGEDGAEPASPLNSRGPLLADEGEEFDLRTIGRKAGKMRAGEYE